MVTSARRGWIGIDIGTRSIKLVQLERTPAGLGVAEAVVIPRRIEAGGDGLGGSSPSCRDEIAAAMGLGRRFSGRIAACTLSMQWCQSRALNIPAGSLAQQRASIAQELSEAGPQWVNEYEFDFWHTDPAEGADPQWRSVIAFSVLRRHALSVAIDLSRAGLHCRTLDAMPLALSRMVPPRSPADGGHAVAAVDWGFADATFSVIVAGRPTFVRRLRGCGFASVLRSVADALDLSTDEVESLLSARGGAPAETGPTPAIDPHHLLPEIASQPLAVMVEELQRTVAFLQHQVPASVPQRLWLVGGGALWKAAPGFLSARLQIPMETWRPEVVQIPSPDTASLPAEVLAPAMAMSSLAWS